MTSCYWESYANYISSSDTAIFETVIKAQLSEVTTFPHAFPFNSICKKLQERRRLLTTDSICVHFAFQYKTKGHKSTRNFSSDTSVLIAHNIVSQTYLATDLQIQEQPC